MNADPVMQALAKATPLRKAGSVVVRQPGRQFLELGQNR